MTTIDPDIQSLLDGRVNAAEKKDIDAMMSHFAPEIVYYDAVLPLQFTGFDEVRRNFQRWFDGYDGPISLKTKDLSVAVGGDVAFAHMLHLDSGKRTTGEEIAIWVRSTVCCRKIDGTWLVTHEHISLPFNPQNLQAWFAPVE